MASSSYLSSTEAEISEKKNPCPCPYPYPYPSHVNAASFVSVKLSGRDKYRAWKSQMLCLLKSHEMLGFVDGHRRLAKSAEEIAYQRWTRSDALVRGWILGSLSEQVLEDLVCDDDDDGVLESEQVTAEAAWRKLQTKYGPVKPARYEQDSYNEKENSGGDRQSSKTAGTATLGSGKDSRKDQEVVAYQGKSQDHTEIEVLDQIDTDSFNEKENSGGDGQSGKTARTMTMGSGKDSRKDQEVVADRGKSQDQGEIEVVDPIYTDSFNEKGNSGGDGQSGKTARTTTMGSGKDSRKDQEVVGDRGKSQDQGEIEVVDPIYTAIEVEESETVEEETQEAQESEIQRKKEREEKEKKRQDKYKKLYEATLKGNRWIIDGILKEVQITDKISINGSTALHIAIGTGQTIDFIEKLVGYVKPVKKLDEMKNTDGSTALHVAAIVGNKPAAKLLVKTRKQLVSVMDKQGCLPVTRALSNMHLDTFLYLFDRTVAGVGKVNSRKIGDELLVNAIFAKQFGRALKLVKKFPAFANEAALVAIAQNFPSDLTFFQRIIFSCYSCVGIWDIQEKKQGNLEVVSRSRTIRDMLDVDRCWMVCWWFVSRILTTVAGITAAVLAFVLKRHTLNYVVLCLALPFATYLFLILAYHLLVLMTAGVSNAVQLLHYATRPFVFIATKKKCFDDAQRLLRLVCQQIKDQKGSRSDHLHLHLHLHSVLEAAILNSSEVVEEIISAFPDGIWCTDQDGHDIIQLAVIHRSEKVYNLTRQMSEHRCVYKTVKDAYGNNLLHLAGKLAPANKLNLISGAALQLQYELQWFKEVQRFVCPLCIIQKNSSKETPTMVFTREHKDLVKEGEQWMKTTAESCSITAALIITISFAAAITVPGGNHQEKGIPVFSNESAFTIFAISNAISLFTSTTSLLMFLSLTCPPG